MRRHLSSAFLAGTAVVATVYAVVSDPHVRDLVWLVVAWGAVAAIVAGIVVHRPAGAGPWRLTAAGLSATGLAGIVVPASADLAASSLRAATGDLLHLAAYLTIGAAVLWFVRLQTPAEDRESVVDGVIVAVALATVLWSVVIDPAALGSKASQTERVVYVVAPLLPAGVTAICARLLFAAGGRLVAARLLGGAWILAFLGSIGWILQLEAGTFTPGGWADLLWVAALGCAGASALHPSMTALSTPTDVGHQAVSGGRLLVLGLALLATPAALLTAAGVGDVHIVVPVIGAGLIALLVLGRLVRLVREREQAHRDLEARVTQQEVVARLGEAAVGHRPLAVLYAEAALSVAGALDGLGVTVGAERAGPRLDEPTATLLHLPITADVPDGPTLAVTGPESRTLSADERAFLTSVLAVLSGATARRQAEADLRQRALYDGLTRLPNRHLTLEHLGQAVAQRDRGPVGVLFLDLDGFKPVNDAYGHEAGDALLTVLAARLPTALRTGDLLGRLAGDEFVVVAPECDETGLAVLAGRLLEAVRTPVEIGDAVVQVHASIGAVIAAPGDDDPKDLLRRADAAMYRAKSAGGARTSWSTRDPAPAAGPTQPAALVLDPSEA